MVFLVVTQSSTSHHLLCVEVFNCLCRTRGCYKFEMRIYLLLIPSCETLPKKNSWYYYCSCGNGGVQKQDWNVLATSQSILHFSTPTGYRNALFIFTLTQMMSMTIPTRQSEFLRESIARITTSVAFLGVHYCVSCVNHVRETFVRIDVAGCCSF